MTDLVKTKVILPPGSDPSRGPGWTDLWIRAGTSDEDVLDEVWIRDTYHLRGLALPRGGNGEQVSTPPRVVDVGAHTGIFAALCLQLFPDCRVDCVEPDADNLQLLWANLEPWKAQGRVEATHGAVGAALGHVGLVGGNATGHTVPSGEAPLRPKVVDQYPLAMFLDRPTALLKLDVEGAEYDAIAACPSDRLALVDRIVMEWHGTQEAPWIDDAPRRYGEMLRKLAYTHSVTVFGAPDRGGYLYAHRNNL